MNYERAPLLDKLAGAYVLGTMSARARRRFSAVLAQSLPAQRAVAQWNDHLAPLGRAVAPVAPRAQVWQQIAQRTQAPVPARTWLQRLPWHWLDSFKPALAFSLGVVLAVGVVQQAPQTLGLAPVSARLAPAYVGVLSNAQGDAVLGVTSPRRAPLVTVKVLKPLAVPAGQVAVLWALADGRAPLRVGAVPASGKADIALAAPADTVFTGVSRLAVSVESSASVAAPSGPFVASGHCAKLW